MDRNCFEAGHITAISGHKNESTIKTYSTKCPEVKKRQMYDTLKDAVIPKKKKAAETVMKPPEKALSTINIDQMKELNYDMNINQNNNNTNNELPANFQLMPFDLDGESDDFLLDYMNSNPQMLEIENPKTTKIVSNTSTTNSNTTTMPIIPKMYFSNSSVTINYNFNSK